MEFGGEGDMYLPGAASLLEQLDKRILIILRDGRHLVGMLRSFDQYLNLVIEDTSERLLMTGIYCDVPLGLYIVRGDNIVLLGELDAEKEEHEMPLRRVDPEDLEEIPDMADEKLPWDFE
jgi:U6 snRNA-associated Sm-like protein LSm1